MNANEERFFSYIFIQPSPKDANTQGGYKDDWDQVNFVGVELVIRNILRSFPYKFI